MKTVLRATSGILAFLSLLLVVLRMYAFSETGTHNSVSIQDLLGLIFPLSVTLLFGYIAIKGRMPFMAERPSSDNPSQESH
jgi:hypothetical protein